MSTMNVSSLSSTSPLQITGLASGLDTNSIISSLMAVNSRPLLSLQSQVSGVKARDAALGSVQSALQNLVASAQSLASVSLFQNVQTVTSTNPGIVSASATSNAGAVVGGYQVGVSQMATAAQQTFNFTSPSAATTLQINHAIKNADGTTTTAANTYNIAAGAAPQDVVNQINGNTTGSVWATVVNGSIVLSDRTTGSNSSFSLGTGATGGLTAAGAQTAGQDAQFTVNGTAGTSHTNTVTSAIPGVTLILGGVTGSGSPVTVNVGAPSVSTDAVTKAVQSFVSTYNSVLQSVSSQLATPRTSDPTVGTLYMDSGLNGLLTSMRQVMYTPGSGLPQGMASMLDIGVSTGTATGSATLNQNNVRGQLTLDTAALTKAITTNPSGVKAVLQSWSQSFASTVNAVASANGTISSRITGDQTAISRLNNQISVMQSALADQQKQLTTTFANLEGALSQNQSTSSWLASQLAALPTKF